MWRYRITLLPLIGISLVAAMAAPAKGQPLTLEEALRRADAGAYANRIGAARAEESATHATAALRGILPTVRLESGFVRTTDPIGTFGTTLRQRTITQADFDPARLNYPGPRSNFAGALVVEQPIFHADAHLGRRAAKRVEASARASAEWTRQSTRLDVIRAWYGAVLAMERVTTLEAAHAAARGHVDQARVLVRAGMVTKSDALLAEVKAGEIEVRLVEAGDEAELARRELGLLLALPADAVPGVPASLPAVAEVRMLLESLASAAPAARADVSAATLDVSAARADLTRATSLHLPRVNGFARYDWNSPDRPYAGDENWTVGVMATWTLFGGASVLAERRAADARLRAATAGAEAVTARAALEARQSQSARRVSLARLDIAERALRQSEEAHRIVSRKYAGGLATVLELLDAAAVETSTKLSLAAARHAGLVSAAEYLRAAGNDPAGITQSLTGTAR